MYLAALAVTAILLAWPAPRWLPAAKLLRRVPGSALVLWQSISLSALISCLALAPLAILQTVRRGHTVPAPTENLGMLALGLAISGLVAVRVLMRGHVVGSNLRRARREHRELVDLLALPPDGGTRPAVPRGSGAVVGAERHLRVLPHPTPTAYCVPGAKRRVVLTDSTIATLPADALRAVLAHERAHLRVRHDLVLEFFTVLHTAVPAALRSSRGLREVRLLIELHADRAAARAVGEIAVGRALVALAHAEHPDAMLGHDGSTALDRMSALRQHRSRHGIRLGVLAMSVIVMLLPVALGVMVVAG